MKMIDVLNMMAKGEIEKNTKLIIYDIFGEFEYKYLKKYRSFVDEDLEELGKQFNIDEIFLKRKVRLEQPKEYYLRLDEKDDLSYVVRSSYNSDFKYDLGSKDELIESQTKFEQEEIDNDKLLKFIEQYGIKEEVED